MIRYLLFTLFLCNGTLVSAQTENYPLPPSGIEWGWQAEVLFALNDAKLRAEDKPTLNQIAQTMRRYTDISLLITGHTDNTGNLDLNRRLSIQRVNAVMNYLNKQGIELQRITTQATGEQRPVANNACPEDRIRNRRADLAFFPSGYAAPVSAPIASDTQPETGECEEAREDAAQIQQQR